MNVIDVLIVGFILLGALQGYRKGLMTSIANLLGSIAGFVVAALEYLKVYNWLNERFSLLSWLEPHVYRLVRPSLEAKAGGLEQKGLADMLAALPQGWRDFLAGVDLSGLQVIPWSTVDQVGHRVAGMLAENLLHLFAFALVYFAVVFLVHIAVGIILGPLGLLGGTVNRGGGLVFGGLGTLVGLVVVAGLLSPLLKIGSQGPVVSLIRQSYFLPYLLKLFHVLSQAFASQLGQHLLQPFNGHNGIWF